MARLFIFTPCCLHWELSVQITRMVFERLQTVCYLKRSDDPLVIRVMEYIYMWWSFVKKKTYHCRGEREVLHQRGEEIMLRGSEIRETHLRPDWLCLCVLIRILIKHKFSMYVLWHDSQRDVKYFDVTVLILVPLCVCAFVHVWVRGMNNFQRAGTLKKCMCVSVCVKWDRKTVRRRISSWDRGESRWLEPQEAPSGQTLLIKGQHEHSLSAISKYDLSGRCCSAGALSVISSSSKSLQLTIISKLTSKMSFF